MTTWEIKIVKFTLGWKGFDYTKMEKQLSELGTQGWEPVDSIMPSVGSGQTLEIGVVLKRPGQP
jgi:hypothetical protein